MPPPYSQFWNWFGSEEKRLAKGVRAKNSHQMLLEIVGHLGALKPGALAEVDPGKEKPHLLVITADGNRKLVDFVKSLVVAAPPLKHWKVVAFRQRRDFQGTIKFGELTARHTDFLFREMGSAAGKLAIEVQVRGMTSENWEVLIPATFLMLDHLIGEHDVMTKLSVIHICPLTEAHGDQLQPLQKLVPLVDAL